MWKKLTAFFLSLVLLTSTASAGLWPDWAASAEDWAEQNGLSDTFLDPPRHDGHTRAGCTDAV